MCVEQKRKFVYTALKKYEAGYTFVSLLLTLVIIMTTIPIIILLLQLVNFEPDEGHIDAHQFFNFLQSDSLVAKSVVVNEKADIIYYQVESTHKAGLYVQASIEKYGSTIRRRVKNQGHEIYLRNIDSFHVQSIPYGFKVHLVMENGGEYEKTIEFAAARK